MIAATNRFEDIDEAVLRRFECKVPVGVPNRNSRKKLVIKFLHGIDHELTEDDLEYISNLTFGWSGSDIEVNSTNLVVLQFQSQFNSNLINCRFYAEKQV